jgi:hypothetical protein
MARIMTARPGRDLPTGRRISAVCVPEDQLAAEIEFAITYIVACNRDRVHELLLTPPDGCRRDFAAAIAGMIAERAAHGLSGMALHERGAGEDAPGET